MKDTYDEHKLRKDDPRNWFRGQPIISDQISREGLDVVITQLEKALDKGAEGAIVEFGCYVGTTSLFIRRVLDERQESKDRPFHVYDSFEGLPEKTLHDNSPAGVDFEAGKLFVSKKEFLGQFRAASLHPPVVHKGWFSELSERDIPDKIAFAFLDGDFYGSIIDSLRLVWPHMAERGIIVIDDYNREALPGVDRAITDFFHGKPVKSLRGSRNKAIIEL
ncbi:MAG TPA: TylF/MycF/NovP-related O-methyltransferase [Candidatus Saccharimonadales bacterium]|nr:TylF/MycF/NovP-related O-methyltransferase [Candidatus Saccharimonadales bacterium]